MCEYAQVKCVFVYSCMLEGGCVPVCEGGLHLFVSVSVCMCAWLCISGCAHGSLSVAHTSVCVCEREKVSVCVCAWDALVQLSGGPRSDASIPFLLSSKAC